MDDFTFLNVSQLIYYDDDEYFLLLSFLNTPPWVAYNFFGCKCSMIMFKCAKKLHQKMDKWVMVIRGVNDLHISPHNNHL